MGRESNQEKDITGKTSRQFTNYFVHSPPPLEIFFNMVITFQARLEDNVLTNVAYPRPARRHSLGAKTRLCHLQIPLRSQVSSAS